MLSYPIEEEPLTAEEFFLLAPDHERSELVAGDMLREPPAGFGHGVAAADIGVRLASFVEEHGLGIVCAAETGFVLARDPDTVRGPDAAFVTAERAAAQLGREGFFEGAPDLAVEVVSPGDSDPQVRAKVADYLAAGTRLVWVVRPRHRTVSVHRPDAPERLLTLGDVLDGGELLPGFALPVAQLFRR